jgi:hypothetical protein
MTMDFQQMEQPYGMAEGGLAALSAPMAPMAQQVQAQGRGEDTMLVHMTPGEINSLQGLAMAHGGSLTINPETGLPEAGFLGKILKKLAPTLIGGLLAATGVGAPLAAGLVGAGSVLKTGSLKKGLMAGLGAFGGASLAGAAGLGGAISKTGFGTLSGNSGIFGANMGLGTIPTNVAGGAVSGFGSSADMAREVAANAAKYGAANASAAAPQFTGGIMSRFGQAAKAGLPGGIIGKAAPMLAASGLMQGVSGAMAPSGGSAAGPAGQVDNSYQGPYYAQPRKQIYSGTTEDILAGDGGQQKYFDVDMPEIYNTMGQVVQPGSHTVRGTQIMQPVLNPNAKKGQNMYSFQPTTYMGGVDPEEAMVAPEEEEGMGYSAGGELQIANGGFIVDARSTAEAGNGLNQAGQERFKALGGVPINGPGDGVSDSIPARIGNNQPARVAAGEVYMPPEAVRRIGKGDPKRGANKLYAMMNEAHKATKRGQQRNILRGLA